ncbi:hypothetical protein [Shimazuella kribbensis]|uniref:hypothetical protein n=1 Tax=Shimazuella kribbensis TaxID=139808 RepID=UPI00048C9435|nr:hypothetical protein [Shimazuella kribbensis]
MTAITPFPQVSDITETQEDDGTIVYSVVYTTTIAAGKKLNTTVEVIRMNGVTYIQNLQTGKHFSTTALIEVDNHFDRKFVYIRATSFAGRIPIW